jgi:hypothetical protein
MVLIYALGGGFGHLTRACALARAAPPDARIRILTNSPYTAWVARAAPELEIAVHHGLSEILCEMAATQASCLIVDTFPRGLAGELVNAVHTFAGLRVFVQRDLNPHYIAKYDLNAFVANSYDLVLVPGDTTPDSLGPFAQTVITAPWLIRSAGELMPRDRARKLLRLQDEKGCIVVCAAGNSRELAWYGAVVSQLLEDAPECDVRCVAPVRPDACPPECWVSYWPAMDLYSAVDVVIGGAGYNTIYECVACGIPLVAKPWQRKYDRQYLRAARAERIVDTPNQAVAAAVELLAQSQPTERGFHFENGASDAIARIRQYASDIT